MTRLPSFFALVLWCGCGRAEGRARVDAGRSASRERIIDVVSVIARTPSTTTHLQGELAAYESVAIFPRVNGFVGSITVDRASIVHRGQVLARLVAPELAAQRAEAQARLDAEQSTLDRLRAAAQTPGVVAGNDVEIAAAAASADRAHVRALRDLESYLVITAPFDGVVIERNVHPGALVSPTADGTPMLRIDQLVRLRLVTAVPEQLAGDLSEGAATTFTVRAWPETRFTGTIRRPSHVIDPRTRTMAVELDVDNADGRLAPGMYADVEWPVRRTSPSLFVPQSAVVQDPERTFVARVREGAIDRVTVRRGMNTGAVVEVFGELQPGDLVARRGNEELRAGDHVEPRIASDAGP